MAPPVQPPKGREQGAGAAAAVFDRPRLQLGDVVVRKIEPVAVGAKDAA